MYIYQLHPNDDRIENKKIKEILKEEYCNLTGISENDFPSKKEIVVTHLSMQIPFSLPTRYIYSIFSEKKENITNKRTASDEDMFEKEAFNQYYFKRIEPQKEDNILDNDFCPLNNDYDIKFYGNSEEYDFKINEKRCLEFQDMIKNKKNPIEELKIKFKNNIPREAVVDIGYVLQ